MNCSRFGPRLPFNWRVWCSGAWLPHLGLWHTILCDSQRENLGERLGWSPYEWKDFDYTWELHVGTKLLYPVYEKLRLIWEIPLFITLCTALVGWVIWNHYSELFHGLKMTNTLHRVQCLSSPTKVPYYTASLTVGFNTRSGSGFDNGPTSLQWE